MQHPAFRDVLCALTCFFEIGFDAAPGFSRLALCFVDSVNLVTNPSCKPLKAEIPAHRYFLTLTFTRFAHAEQLVL